MLDPNRPVLPEWTRWSWASEVEREFWSEAISSASRAYQKIELASVQEGIRPATFQYVPMTQFVQMTSWASKNGLVVVPIAQVTQPRGYSSSASPTGTPDSYRALIGKPDIVGAISASPNIASDNEALGKLLGYPVCCREMFHRTWGQGQVDSTYEQFENTDSITNAYEEANLLWRWLGIRLVSHLPCSFTCEATRDIGAAHVKIGNTMGLGTDVRTIQRILNWPTTWSGVNGIAEITGPCVKVSTRTDWAPPTAMRRFTKPGVYIKPVASMWTDNGFKAYKPMIASHDALIATIDEFAPMGARVVDLGCGNGGMLRKFNLKRPDTQVFGVDLNESAIKNAQKLSKYPKNWVVGNYTNIDLWQNLSPDVVVYSPAHLSVTPDKEFLETIKLASVHIVYVYSDNLAKMNLEEWVRSRGIPHRRMVVTHFPADKSVEVAVLYQ